MHDEIAKALNDPAMKELIKKLGADPMLLNPAEFDAFVRAESNRTPI
jgi:tripartite-type tricarboxylate transporter receptor subunit TctC